MSFEEEFDKIIRQKTNDADFPFDEKNWEKMSAVLDAGQTSTTFSTKNKFYAAALLVLILFVSGFYLFQSSKIKNLAEVKKSNSGNAVSNDNSSAMKTSVITSKSGELENATNEKKSLNQFEKANHVYEAVSSEGAEKVVDKIVKVESNKKVEDEGTVKRKPIIPSKKISKRESGNVSLGFNKTVKNKIGVPETNHKINERTSEKDLKIQKSENGLDQESKTGVNSKVALASSQALQYSNAQDFSAATPVSEKNTNVYQTPSTFESMVMINTELPISTLENDLLPAQFLMLKYFDDDYYKPKNSKKHFLTVEAGTGYLMGWEVKKGNDGKGFNWFGGINYGLYVSKKITVGLGAQVYNITNINEPFYTHKQTEYGFGSIGSNTIITSHSLYYGAIPVRFSYVIDSQSQIGVGFNMGFLVNSNNNLETFTISEYGKTNVANQKKMVGYKDIASTSMLLSAFYKTQLAKRWALNGEIIYGLNDLFKNTSTINNNEKAVGLRVSLQYTFFDK